jgi:ABC-type Mn2+/Zn2+ transport system ATPase subunit
MDEPEQRLDERGRAWLGDRLIAEKEAGTAVLVSSHDAGLMERIADSRIVLGG